MTTPAPLMAEELMIGNYLKTVEFSNEYFEVRAISKDRLLPLTLVDKDGYSVDWRLDEAIPIPLTEQWLKEFGFVEEDNGTWQNEIALYEGSEGYNYNASFFEHHNFVTIKYVHQLQNLYFALTATKLERGGV